MIAMSRTAPVTLAALFSGFALVASLPVPCPCLPEPVKTEDHGCCAPAAGWRTANLGCCTATAEPAPETPATTPALASAVLPSLVAVVGVVPSAAFAPERAEDSPRSLHSPPLTVRRV
jgi:hypothetical protein